MLTQKVVLLRHGRRADKEGQPWDGQLSRPWDPPLSSQGQAEATSVRALLRNCLGDKFQIHSSPFLRCLQTAYIVAGNTTQNLTVNLSLSEVYDYFNAVRFVDSPDIFDGSNYVNMGNWFWRFKYGVCDRNGRQTFHLGGQTDLRQQMLKYMQTEIHVPKTVGEFPDYDTKLFPLPGLFCLPRYVATFHQITKDATRDHVIVTHMSGVTSVINSIFGWVKSYVPPASPVILERTLVPGGKPGPWKLVIV